MWQSVIHQSVLDAFESFSTPLEGDELAPYPDNLNLITTAIGCLIESNGSFAMALTVPWFLPDGSRASDAEVIRQLTALKALDLRAWSVKSTRVQSATTIRLEPDGVRELVNQRIAQDIPFLLQAFPAFASWPADAQLYALSMAWAEGPGFAAKNPNLARVLRLSPPNFLAAIAHAPVAGHPGMFGAAAADISTKGNPGVVPRNAQNELALSNAQVVTDQGLDPSVLHWPRSPLNDTEPAPPPSQGAA